MLQSQLVLSSTQNIPAASTSSSDTHSAAHITTSPSPSNHSASQQRHFTGTISFPPFVASVNSLPSWIIDTGATHHVCCNLSLFSSSTSVTDAFVNLPNGGTSVVTHIGTVHSTPKINLSSVLCVPCFTFNLISVSSLSSSLACTVNFTHNSITIQEASQGILIGKGSRTGNLYTLHLSGVCIFCRKPKITSFQRTKAKAGKKRRKETEFELIKSIFNLSQPDPALERDFTTPL